MTGSREQNGVRAAANVILQEMVSQKGSFWTVEKRASKIDPVAFQLVNLEWLRRFFLPVPSNLTLENTFSWIFLHVMFLHLMLQHSTIVVVQYTGSFMRIDLFNLEPYVLTRFWLVFLSDLAWAALSGLLRAQSCSPPWFMSNEINTDLLILSDRQQRQQQIFAKLA